MQRIKKELERAKEKESNHLKCCSGSIGGVIAKKKKNKNQREFKAVHFRQRKRNSKGENMESGWGIRGFYWIIFEAKII